MTENEYGSLYFGFLQIIPDPSAKLQYFNRKKDEV